MNIENLIFEGGGVHGISYIGALTELTSAGHIDSLKRVAGTSIGALIATAVALRLTPEQMSADFKTMTSSAVLPRQCFFMTVYNLIKKWGFYDSTKVTGSTRPATSLRSWLEGWLEKHGWSKDVTLGQLSSRTDIDLYIAVYNRTRCRGEVLSRHNYPDAPLVFVLLAAMAVPPIFAPVKVPIGNDLIIDGGMTNNFPMYVFDSEEFGGTGSYNCHTIGMRSTSDQSLYFSEDINYTPPPPRSVFEYFSGIVEVIMESGQQRHEREFDAARTCFIVIPRRISSLSFDISDEDREVLFNLGRHAMARDVYNKFG